jgi:signal peptidase I
MGDNRNYSLDSRSDVIGTVDERYVLGKAFLRILPFDSFGKVYGQE